MRVSLSDAAVVDLALAYSIDSPGNGEGPRVAAREPAVAPLGVRLRRIYAAPGEAVFAAWTSRHGWSAWMQLRARSRATLAAYVGGAYRLEIADGPIIHVITGAVQLLRPEERLVLTWLHHDMAAEPSVVDVTLRAVAGGTELTLDHQRMASRRQVAWTRRAWELMLDRLGECVSSRAAADIRVPPASLAFRQAREVTAGHAVQLLERHHARRRTGS